MNDVLKRFINESIIDFKNYKNKKDAQVFDRCIATFIMSWDAGLDKLNFAKEFMSNDEIKTLNVFIRNYKKSAEELSSFLGRIRKRMK